MRVALSARIGGEHRAQPLREGVEEMHLLNAADQREQGDVEQNRPTDELAQDLLEARRLDRKPARDPRAFVVAGDDLHADEGGHDVRVHEPERVSAVSYGDGPLIKIGEG
jgi:hypothetical protein